jgi:hypothetical protein
MRSIDGTNEANNDPTREISAPSRAGQIALIALCLLLLAGLMVAIAMLTSR